MCLDSWKRQLQKKQEDAEFTKETIKILVENILPVHVGNIETLIKFVHFELIK